MRLNARYVYFTQLLGKNPSSWVKVTFLWGGSLEKIFYRAIHPLCIFNQY